MNVNKTTDTERKIQNKMVRLRNDENISQITREHMYRYFLNMKETLIDHIAHKIYLERSRQLDDAMDDGFIPKALEEMEELIELFDEWLCDDLLVSNEIPSRYDDITKEKIEFTSSIDKEDKTMNAHYYYMLETLNKDELEEYLCP